MTKTEYFEDLHFDRTVNTIRRVPEKFPIHWHKYAEVLLLPSDARAEELPELCVQQEVYRLQPGDLLFIWPGELHEILRNGEGKLSGLQFPSVFINELPEFAPFVNCLRIRRHIRYGEVPSLAEKMAMQLHRIFQLDMEDGRFCGVESMICLLELFIEFGKYLDQDIPRENPRTVQRGSRTAEKMMAACSYIIENSEHDLTLDSVAEHIGYSACYFSRVFKQATNYSFVEYLTIQRVQHAKALLADATKSIADVIASSGFKSVSTFNRVFKRYGGCSPSEYRNYYNAP